MMEKPLYPSQYMRITQGYMQGTHQDSYAIDEAGSDAGIDYMKAPFTGIIKKDLYQRCQRSLVGKCGTCGISGWNHRLYDNVICS